jgi:hypothetical protein
VARQQGLQHLPPHRRQALAPGGAKFFRMHDGRAGAAIMIVIRCRKDGGFCHVLAIKGATLFEA